MLLQRVANARVHVEQKEVASIAKGLLLLVGVEEADEEADARYLAEKLIQLRVFADDSGKTNLSIRDIEGELLLVSQFTLYASAKKGNRPSFIRAARPEKALLLFNVFSSLCEQALPGRVKSGVFGAHMQVSLLNDGPFTLMLDSRNME